MQRKQRHRREPRRARRSGLFAFRREFGLVSRAILFDALLLPFAKIGLREPGEEAAHLVEVGVASRVQRNAERIVTALALAALRAHRLRRAPLAGGHGVADGAVMHLARTGSAARLARAAAEPVTVGRVLVGHQQYASERNHVVFRASAIVGIIVITAT